jgi:hypothetical protein
MPVLTGALDASLKALEALECVPCESYIKFVTECLVAGIADLVMQDKVALKQSETLRNDMLNLCKGGPWEILFAVDATHFGQPAAVLMIF